MPSAPDSMPRRSARWYTGRAVRIDRRLRRRGFVTSVNLNGLSPEAQYEFMTGLAIVARRFPLALQGVPIEVRPARAEEWDELDKGQPDPERYLAQYHQDDEFGRIVLFRLDEETARDTAIHECIHHMRARMSPAARLWMWRQLHGGDGPDVSGTGLPKRIEQRAATVHYAAARNEEEFVAYTATRLLLARRTRPWRPTDDSRHWDALSVIFGHRPFARVRLERQIGSLLTPLRSLRTLQRTAVGGHLAEQGQRRISIRQDFARVAYVRTATGRRYQVSRGRAVDVDASLELGRIVHARGNWPSLTLVVGSRLVDPARRQTDMIAEVVVLTTHWVTQLQMGRFASGYAPADTALIFEIERIVTTLRLLERRTAGLLVSSLSSDGAYSVESMSAGTAEVLAQDPWIVTIRRRVDGHGLIARRVGLEMNRKQSGDKIDLSALVPADRLLNAMLTVTPTTVVLDDGRVDKLTVDYFGYDFRPPLPVDVLAQIHADPLRTLSELRAP